MRQNSNGMSTVRRWILHLFAPSGRLRNGPSIPRYCKGPVYDRYNGSLLTWDIFYKIPRLDITLDGWIMVDINTSCILYKSIM